MIKMNSDESEIYDPNQMVEQSYDDRNDPEHSDNEPTDEFVVDEQMSRNVGWSGRDPAELAL